MSKHQQYSLLVKNIRAKFRNIKLVSIIHTARKILFNEEKIKYCPPAYVLLMLKITIEDKLISISNGDECDEHFFLKCSRELFSKGSMIFTSILNEPTEQNINKWARTYLQNQLIQHAELTRGLFRIPLLIQKYDKKNRCSAVFERLLGMHSVDFITAAMLVYVPIQNEGKGTHLNTIYYEDLNDNAKKVVLTFLSKFSKTIEELRTILQQELHERIRKWGTARSYLEIVEIPWLSRYPLLKINEREYLTWQPRLLALSLENAAHMIMSDAGPDYTESFSQIFETYVIDLLKWSGLDFITEEEFARFPGNSRRVKVDSIINFNKKINIYVEVKMSLYKDDLIINDDSEVIYNKLERIRDAMGQGWTVSEYFYDDQIQIEPYLNAKQHYMFIITNKEIFCPSGCHAKDLVGDKMFENFVKDPERNHNTKRLKILPLENIFILSIENFEYLINGINTGKVNLEEFLKQVCNTNLTIKGTLSQIPDLLSEKTELDYPPILEEEFNRVQENSRKLLLGEIDIF